MFLTSGCSSVARNEGWAIGGGGGGGGVGGSTKEGSSTSKDCPSHHKYKSSKQFELKGSKSTKCPLGATCLSGQTKNWSSEKSHKKDGQD